MMEYRYNFPETRFVPGKSDTTRRGQADQIVQEAAEAFSEAERGGSRFDYIAELLDCVHACETALREFDDDDINRVMHETVMKNVARDYYATKTTTVTPAPVGDAVNHPAHYERGNIEAIQVIEEVVSGLKGDAAYCMGNVLKYALRAGAKDDLKTDLEKANNYAHRLVYGTWRWQHGEA